MFEFLQSYPKVAIGIFTPMMVAVGYLIRMRWESNKNRKLALYSLMEIWHRVSVFYRSNFDDVFELLAAEVGKHCPTEAISAENADAARKVLTPILVQSARQAALSDLDGYLDSYEEAILLIAGDDPMLAYKINSAGNTKKILVFLDSYLEQLFTNGEKLGARSPSHAVLRESMSEHMQTDALKTLESDIKRLSLKISFLTFLVSKRAIRKRKNQLERVDDDSVSEIVANVLVPMLANLDKGLRDTA